MNAENSDNTSVMDAIRKHAQDLTSLKITTAVGNISYVDKGDEGFVVAIPAGAETRCMRSKIDLLDGDIETLIDEKFSSDENKHLMDFHLEREKQGQAIIKGNIEALKALVGLIRDIGSGGQ